MIDDKKEERAGFEKIIKNSLYFNAEQFINEAACIVFIVVKKEVIKLTLRELLKDADIHFVVDYMRDIIEDGIQEVEVDVELIKHKLTTLLNELIALPSIPSNLSSIAVIKIADTDINNNIKYYYDVVCIDRNHKHYSLMGVDVREMLELDIYQPSIDIYDIQSVISAIIYEITWFGWTLEAIDKNRESFSRELEETSRKYDEMSEDEKNNNIYTLEEFQKQLENKIGFVLTPDEELEDMKEKMKECNALNKDEYVKLGLSFSTEE